MADRSEGVALRVQERPDRYEDGVPLNVRPDDAEPAKKPARKRAAKKTTAKKAAKKTAASPSAPTEES